MPTRRARTYFQGPDGLQYDKFSTNNRPSKLTFNYLFQSVGFIAEKDDTASTSSQGFGKIASDTRCQTNDSTLSGDGFTTFVRPHQLPWIVAEGGSNQLSVTPTYGTSNRTGGSGNTFTVKNLLTVANDGTTPIPFVTVTQSNPGEAVTLVYSSANFNTAVGNCAAYTTLYNTFVAAMGTIGNGKLGEIKMYGFYNEEIGATNCEFDATGIGRAAGINGATGIWEGWVLLIGTAIASLTGADATITARLDTGAGNIPDTRQAYPSGVVPAGGTADKKMFNNNGANTHTPAASDLYPHVHAAGTLKMPATATGGESATHKHSMDFEGTGLDSMPESTSFGNQSTPGHNYDTNFNLTDHTHTVPETSITGSTATLGAATPFDIRPLSFTVCYAMFVDATGSVS